MVRLGNPLGSLTVGAHLRRGKLQVGIGRRIEEPEGHVDALDLLDMVVAAETARQELLALIILLQGANRGLLVQLERQNIVGLEHPGELPRDD